MDYITIGGRQVPYPNNFQMQATENVVAQVTLLNGSVVGDYNGYRFENTTMQWDTLLETDLQNLLEATSTTTFNVTYKDITGTEITVLARKVSRVETKTRFHRNGNAIWKDIQLELAFPNVYH